MYVVYCHTNRSNDKLYIGWAIIAEGQAPYDAMMRRWDTHCKNPRSDLFPRAIRKHGVAVWDHEVLDVVTELKTAKYTERLWIAQRKTCAFDLGGHGYNMTRGGDGGGMLGHVPTPEHREKLSAALIGVPKSTKAKRNMSLAKTGEKHPFFDKKRPPEVGAKISKAQSGEKSHLAKLTQGEKVAIQVRWANRYEMKVTQMQLALEHGVTQSTISRLVGGKTWKQ